VFSLELLPPGSVLNFRLIFLEDQMTVNLRAAEPSTYLELPLKSIQRVRVEYDHFDKKIQAYTHRLLMDRL